LDTNYGYDGLGRVISMTSPDSGTTTYALDANGNRVREQDARGVVATRTFDGLNRVVTESYPATAENIRYYYDASSGGHYEVGHLAGITDESGSTFFDYDINGNTVADTRVIAGRNYQSQYRYDAANHISGMTYPSGHVINYSRDAMGRVSGITYQPSSGAAALTLASSIRYNDMEGQPANLFYGNGLLRQLSYDLDGRLLNIPTYNPANNVPVQNLSLVYDLADNLTKINDWMDNARTQDFTYDILYRLLGASSGKYGSLQYSYDVNGNRVSKAEGGVTKNYVYPAASNRLSGMTSGGSSVRSLNYDARGNVVSDSGNATFTYNNRNLLSQATGYNGATSSYKYNAFGQRALKTTGAATVAFVYDVQGHLIAEHNGATGAVVREYVYFNDEPVAQIEGNGAVYYLHNDNMGNPQKMTDANRNIVWDRIQKPFGETVSVTGAAATNLRFPGQYNEAEMPNLVYNMHRYYDPLLARYTQTDPIGLAGGVNLYSYVKDSPNRWVDPLGLWTVQLGGAFNGTFFGFNFNFGGGIAFDGNGNVGAYSYNSIPGYGSGSGFGGSLGFQASNADTICDLRGPFANQGGDAGLGVKVSVDAFEGQQENGKNVFGLGAGLGFGEGADVYAGGTTTYVTPFLHR